MHGDDILSIIFLALICLVVAALVGQFARDKPQLIIPSFIFIAISLWIAYDYMTLQRNQERKECPAEKESFNVVETIDQLVSDINSAPEDNTVDYTQRGSISRTATHYDPETNFEIDGFTARVDTGRVEEKFTAGQRPENNFDNIEYVDDSGELSQQWSADDVAHASQQFERMDNPAGSKPINKSTDEEFDIDLYNKKTTVQELHELMGCNGDNKLCNRMKYMSMQPQAAATNRSAWNARKLQPWVEEELREQESKIWWGNSDFLDKFM